MQRREVGSGGWKGRVGCRKGKGRTYECVAARSAVGTADHAALV